MNREILFRGKRVDNEEWIYGNYIEKIDPTKAEPTFWASLIHDKALTAHQVIPETVGQFTGLTDKNGTKIFEGDLVEVPDYSIGIALTFKQPTKIVKAEYRNGWNLTVGLDFKGSLVTGNIHDNPTP